VGEEIDFFAELGKHLEDGWIAEVREIGYEKLRFLFGDAVAVTNKGMLVVSLDDIRDKAQSYFGDDHKMTANIKKRGVKKMSVTTYAELAHHLGHRIVCTEYGNGENIAIECEKCWTVITSFDYQEKETENEYYFLRGHIGHKVACKKLPTGEPVIVCKDCGEVVLHSPK
jgi:hypothetical protein